MRESVTTSMSLVVSGKRTFTNNFDAMTLISHFIS